MAQGRRLLFLKKNRWQDALVHARPGSAITANDCNAAQPAIAAVTAPSLAIGLVTVWCPDFATAVFAIFLRLHIPDNIFPKFSICILPFASN